MAAREEARRAALASWRRIFRRSSAAAASTSDERSQHAGLAKMHAAAGSSDNGHEEGRRVLCRCCAGVVGAGSSETVITLQRPPRHTNEADTTRHARKRHCKHCTGHEEHGGDGNTKPSCTLS